MNKSLSVDETLLSSFLEIASSDGSSTGYQYWTNLKNLVINNSQYGPVKKIYMNSRHAISQSLPFFMNYLIIQPSNFRTIAAYFAQPYVSDYIDL